MLRDIEYLATLATIKKSFGKKSSYKYPKKDLDDMWENVLLCQFHDCLPGSSIEMCYRDSDEVYLTCSLLMKCADPIRSMQVFSLPVKNSSLMHWRNLVSIGKSIEIANSWH